MRTSLLLVGTMAALVSALHALPAVALTKRAGPAPTDHLLPPGACDVVLSPVSGTRMPCVPPGIDPRVAGGPACCRSDVVLPPPSLRWPVPPELVSH